LQNDKAKIKKVIEELDEKKKETLKVMWLKVNKHESFDDSLHISADSVSLYILLKMSLILELTPACWGNVVGR
jgi:hypothetical protein